MRIDSKVMFGLPIMFQFSRILFWSFYVLCLCLCIFNSRHVVIKPLIGMKNHAYNKIGQLGLKNSQYLGIYFCFM